MKCYCVVLLTMWPWPLTSDPETCRHCYPWGRRPPMLVFLGRVVQYLSDASLDLLATLTFDLGGHGTCRGYGSSCFVCVPSLNFVGLPVRKILGIYCMSINPPDDLDLWFLNPKTVSLLVYPKIIPYTKFEYFGLIRFRVMLRTNRQTNRLTRKSYPWPTDRVGVGNKTVWVAWGRLSPFPCCIVPVASDSVIIRTVQFAVVFSRSTVERFSRFSVFWWRKSNTQQRSAYETKTRPTRDSAASRSRWCRNLQRRATSPRWCGGGLALGAPCGSRRHWRWVLPRTANLQLLLDQPDGHPQPLREVEGYHPRRRSVSVDSEQS